ncbi:MAG: hypothetical protein ACJ74O_11205 [Frankiaceae bacterium]
MTVSALPFAALGLSPRSPLAAALRDQLAWVELALERAAASVPLVIDRDRQPFAAEGVRVHATLALLGGQLAGPAGSAAVVVELTHLATRFHDAVRDLPPGSAGGQRNVDAVLAGDLLIVRATGLAADLPRPALRRWAAALGEVHEAKLVRRFDVAARALLDAAVEIGALAAGTGTELPETVAAVRASLERHLAGRLTTSAAPAARAAP